MKRARTWQSVIASGCVGIVAMMAFLILENLASRAMADDCNSENPGCYYSVPVPCSNATCADITDLSVDDRLDIQYCEISYGQTPTKYTANTAPGWNRCQSGLNASGGSTPCNETDRVCANVDVYIGSSCTFPNKCNSEYRTILRCGPQGAFPCTF